MAPTLLLILQARDLGVNAQWPSSGNATLQMVSVALTAFRIIYRTSWVFEPSEVFRILIDASPLTLRSKAARGRGVCHFLHQLKYPFGPGLIPIQVGLKPPILHCCCNK